MSTGADCRFREKALGKWFYDLQCHPYGSTEDYDVFGPFPTFREAHEHLSRNHANPGGFSVHHTTKCAHPERHRYADEGQDPLTNAFVRGQRCAYCGEFLGTERRFGPAEQEALAKAAETAKTVFGKAIKGLRIRKAVVSSNGLTWPGVVLNDAVVLVAVGCNEAGAWTIRYAAADAKKSGRLWLAGWMSGGESMERVLLSAVETVAKKLLRERLDAHLKENAA